MKLSHLVGGSAARKGLHIFSLFIFSLLPHQFGAFPALEGVFFFFFPRSLFYNDWL